jgi:tetratricopeptide (TPR) repeat protein
LHGIFEAALMTWRLAAAVGAVFALLAALVSAAAQKPLEHVRPDVVAEYRQAVQQYRAGRLEDALAILTKRRPHEWQQLVDALLRDLEIQARTRDPLHLLDPNPFEAELAHNTALARSAAALHMEAALAGYGLETPPLDDLDRHVMLGEWLFAFVATQDGMPSAASDWERELGLSNAARGDSGLAARVLDAACRKFPRDGALQLARGSVYESRASLPASRVAIGPLVVVTGGIALWENTLTTARAARDRQRAIARDSLERALAILPESAEARVRLAHLRLLDGEAAAAAHLLLEVLGDVAAPRRDAYLARLLLGRVRQKQDRLEEGAALYEEAASIVPSAQSAFAALVDLARRRGDIEGTARATARMLAAPRVEDDPWVHYRFAQYWLKDDLLARLRREARR